MKKRQKFIKTIRRNGSSLAINIPKEILNLLKLKEGDMIEVEINKVK